MTLLIPAVSQIKDSGNLSAGAETIADMLEQARTHAMANSTYVWVGFFEEDGATTSAKPAVSGTGRVVLMLVASANGKRYSDTTIDASNPPAFGSESVSASQIINPAQLRQLGKLIKLEGLHLAAVNLGKANAAANRPPRPGVDPSYQVGSPAFEKHSAGETGSVQNPTTFTYPLTVNGARPANLQYTFTSIIEINPQGEASKIVENTYSGPGPQDALEISLQPTHGHLIDARYSEASSALSGAAAAAIQIEGLTGHVSIFRL